MEAHGRILDMKKKNFLSTLVISLALSAGLLSNVWAQTPAPAATATAPAPAAASSQDDQKTSYSLGFYMGEQIRLSLQAQDITVNSDSFTKGLKDAVLNATPTYSTEEMQRNLLVLQQSAQTKLDSKVRTLAAERANALFGTDQIIVAGNPKGNVTLVEFSDYECPHCKAMTPIINDLIKNNKDLRVVYRPFPIINENSTNAAVAAFAAQQQNKFPEFHTALMAADKPLTEEEIRKIARASKIDMKKFEVALKGNRAKDEIKVNRDLGLAIGLRGTPSLIIAKTVQNPDDKQTWPTANHIYFASGEVTNAVLSELINKAAQ